MCQLNRNEYEKESILVGNSRAEWRDAVVFLIG